MSLSSKEFRFTAKPGEVPTMPASVPSAMNPLAPEGLSEVYRLVEGDLDSVAGIIRNRLRHSNPVVDEILRYSFKLGGKRLRPLLLLLVARVCGGIKKEHLCAAAALEMIHTGTLVHDDILDGARFRRHLETINLRWDSQFAVLAGDLLLTKAISLITEFADQESYRVIADACRKTCEGELLQVSFRGRFDMTLDDYWTIIDGKTASLIEVSCRLGTFFSGSSKERGNGDLDGIFAGFGRNLGLAFQIFDDILDLVGSSDVTGKTLGTDLLNQKPTLPLIHYLETAGSRNREEMLLVLSRSGFGERDAVWVKEVLERSGAVEHARRHAFGLVAEASALLEPFAESGDPDRREAALALKKVAQFVVDRNT